MYFCALCCQEEATSSQESCDGLSSPKPTSSSTSAKSRSDDFCLKKNCFIFHVQKKYVCLEIEDTWQELCAFLQLSKKQRLVHLK